jgi:hypothetical protein
MRLAMVDLGSLVLVAAVLQGQQVDRELLSHLVDHLVGAAGKADDPERL